MRRTLLLLLGACTNTALAATGSLSLLTINIAGLPAWINNNGVPGDKTTNTARMGQLLSRYSHDVIHVQEDFAYHDTLYANDNHTQRTVTSGNVPFGSGLNTLANYGWTDFRRITWERCFIGSGDCLTPKGFTYMRLKLQDRTTIDVYNVHHDAGSEQFDVQARADNNRQVAAFIQANSKGQAVIVAGDTNSRYTRTGDGIRQLSAVGLTDTWVQLAKGGVTPTEGAAANVCPNPAPNTQCEIVDKILYRSGDTVKLEASQFRYLGKEFNQPDGSILTDHDPVLVNFKWTST